MRDYWANVARHAAFGASGGAKLREKIEEAIAYIVILVVSIIVLDRTSDRPFLDFLRGNSGYGILFVLLSIASGFLPRFLWNLVKQPAKLHNEKTDEIKRLSGFPSDIIKTTLKAEKRNRLDGRVGGIEIYNSSDDAVSLLNVRLCTFGLESSDRTLKPQQVNSFNNEFASGENCESHNIPAHGSVIIYLARPEIDKDVFLLKKTLELPTDNETGTYSLVLAIDGYIGDKQMETVQYKATIVFHKGGEMCLVTDLEQYASQVTEKPKDS